MNDKIEQVENSEAVSEEAEAVPTIASFKKKKEENKANLGEVLPVDHNYFEDVMKKNQDSKKRLEEERLKANKGVLRSYRLKN